MPWLCLIKGLWTLLHLNWNQWGDSRNCFGGSLVEGHLSSNVFYAYLSILDLCVTETFSTWGIIVWFGKGDWPDQIMDCGSQREDKLHCTRTLRNLREHEGHYLNHDLPMSAESFICFKTQKARTFCEVQYLCSDPTGNVKGKCTCTHSTSSDLWSTFSFCGKCSVITLLWSYQTWNVQKKWDWVDGIFKKRNIKSDLLTLCPRFENKLLAITV